VLREGSSPREYGLGPRPKGDCPYHRNAVDNGPISLLARTDSPNVCVGAARSPATLVAGVRSVPSNRAASPISRVRKRQDRRQGRLAKHARNCASFLRSAPMLLAGQEIADDGFTIGLGGIGLVISDAVLAVVILYQVSGDIVRRLKHAAGHGAHQGLDSIPVPLGPRRGIDDFTAQWRAAIRPAPVPLGL
jgi:hypothetical protein